MAQIVVSQDSFDAIVTRLKHTAELALDTETTGLAPYRGDRLFSIILADDVDEFYFNFNPEAHDFPLEERLPRDWIRRLEPVTRASGSFFMHNAKFDWHFLAQEGLEIDRDVYCTMALARVEYNEHMSYDLDSCLGRIGLEKDDRVKAYLDANKLWEWDATPGSEKRSKRYFFARVPRDIIVPYACADVRGTYALAHTQRKKFAEYDASGATPLSVEKVVRNEIRLTRTCFRAERRGMLIDRTYCNDAFRYETNRAQEAAVQFEQMTGVAEFTDSAKALAPVLTPLGVPPGKTEGGRDSYADAVLQAHADKEPVKLILAYRDATKRANTYFANYLKLADPNHRIHTDLRQGGTGTGRFGSRDPNLQNCTAEDESLFPVRRSFIPDPEHLLLSIDYEQMEYRLMLDYAGEMSVIEEVAGGMDVHEACARMMGVKRSQAKTINFMLLYGGGAAKLATSLGVPLEEAMELRALYFARLPKIRQFIKNVTATAERRGYIFNWMGRRCHFPDPQFAYKAPNYLIQGGCADIIKLAMNQIDELLERRKTRTHLLLNIHDECLFGLHQSEKHLVPEIVRIMENAYTPRSLRMACSVAWSDRSWHDLVEGVPTPPEAVA